MAVVLDCRRQGRTDTLASLEHPHRSVFMSDVKT
jgi:hypothetical protein